jgi:hypothetical protein
MIRVPKPASNGHLFLFWHSPRSSC